MQTTDQSNDNLHQQASAQYLQGKFEEALATWRQILANDPSDERASEGIRLCELLTADGPGEAAATAPVEAVPEPLEPAETEVRPEPQAATEPLDGLEFELPNLDFDLPPAEAPDPSRQDEGIDFGEAPESLLVDGDVPEAPPEEPVVVGEALPEHAPVVEGLVDETPSTGVGDAGATELNNRVRDLVYAARAAHEGGDAQTARAVLQRVFILDETNADALELQEQLEGAVPPPTESAEVADLDAPDHGGTPGQFDLAADDPDALVAAEPEAEEILLADPVLDDLSDDDLDSEFDEPLLDEPLEAPAEPPAKGSRSPQLDSGSSKTRWIVAGVVLGIVLVASVGFWMKLRSASTVEPSDPAAAATAAAALAGDAPAEPEAPGAEAEPASEEAAVVEDVATLLARANGAFDAGDYAQAILAFNAVLEQQPDHVEATSKMEVATRNYRAQQEVQQQWLAATSLFNDGEFRSALQMFYRLPQDSEQDRIRIERYQENGWFNMGLQALRSGQCDMAREHFAEAAQIDPEDADVQMALALCDTCESGARRSGFQRAVASMKLRGLDD